MALTVWISVVFLCVYAASTNAMNTEKRQPAGLGVSMPLDCLSEHCADEAKNCLADTDCKDALGCIKDCVAGWANDTTKEKLVVQNCTNNCQFQYYKNEPYMKVFSCALENGCIVLPPIPDPCRASTAKPAKQLSLKDIEGTWWVVKGFNPVYDCYWCERFTFKSVNADNWEFSYSYDVPLKDGTKVNIDEKTMVPNAPPGQKITFEYTSAGVPQKNSWWLLDKADDSSWVTVYYCGNVGGWNYEGSFVFSRSSSFPDAATSKVAASYNSTIGLDFSQFCTNKDQNCS